MGKFSLLTSKGGGPILCTCKARRLTIPDELHRHVTHLLPTVRTAQSPSRSRRPAANGGRLDLSLIGIVRSMNEEYWKVSDAIQQIAVSASAEVGFARWVFSIKHLD